MQFMIYWTPASADVSYELDMFVRPIATKDLRIDSSVFSDFMHEVSQSQIKKVIQPVF